MEAHDSELPISGSRQSHGAAIKAHDAPRSAIKASTGVREDEKTSTAVGVTSTSVMFLGLILIYLVTRVRATIVLTVHRYFYEAYPHLRIFYR